ncbi:MAG: hypothetical protein V5A30_07645 [Haloarculaceae archaeon]
MSDGDGAPGDRLRERADQSRVKLWLLMEADRWLVVALLVVVVLAVLLAAGYLYPGAAAAVRTGDSVDTAFQGLLTATITGVTLVLTLNQLVLSQELGAVDDQRERMEGAMEFRRDVAEVVGAPVSPSRPAQFLRALVQVSGERAATFREAVGDADDDLARATRELTDSLVENADRVSEGLDDATFGSFDVLSAALNFNYSWKVFAARRIRERHGDALDEGARQSLDDLVDALRLFGPAREHFKTLYFQWDLINLSRRILAAAVPALLVAAVIVLYFDSGRYSVTVAGVDTLAALLAVAATVSLLPFLVLLAYVMRIATVTKHTLSIGPFILRETDKVAEVEWEE